MRLCFRATAANPAATYQFVPSRIAVGIGSAVVLLAAVTVIGRLWLTVPFGIAVVGSLVTVGAFLSVTASSGRACRIRSRPATSPC